MEHPRHGAGVVTELMADGRTRVAYENGEEHRYQPSSMHKLVMVATFLEINHVVWEELWKELRKELDHEDLRWEDYIRLGDSYFQPAFHVSTTNLRS